MAKIAKVFNKDVKQTFFVNLSRLLTGPVSMLVIPLYLTKQMQGYWYSFMSISALSVLADLGFTTIVLQFSAHEYAHLRLNEDNRFEGSVPHYYKLASFFRFIARWGTYTCTLAFPIIFGVGYYMFSREQNSFQWVLPWIVFLIGSGLKFYLNIVISFFEGCGLIAQVQKMRSLNVVLNFVVTIGLLVAHTYLYSLAVASLLTSLLLLWQTLKRFKVPMQQMMHDDIEVYNWRSEVFALMWRYTISWFGGYLIFQLFTPIAFRFHGSVFAGQVGITITLITAIFSMANVWIYVITPKMNMLVSQRSWAELDALFKKGLLKSVGTFIFFAVGCVMVFYLATVYYHKFSDRFMSIENIALLSLAWLAQLIINSFAIYTRANKEEPYVLPSMVKGIYVAVSTFLMALLFPENYLLFGFYSSFLFSIPWFISIYASRRKKMQAVAL
ncbi:hypothetical protein [Mucilaginibacter sp.]